MVKFPDWLLPGERKVCFRIRKSQTMCTKEISWGTTIIKH